MLNLRDVAPAPPLAHPVLVRPIFARSIVAALFLCADLIAALLLLVAHGLRLTLLKRVIARLPVERSALAASDGLVLLWSRIAIWAEVATAVAFLVWLYRANQNLQALRAEPLDFTPRQSVTSFFIPFINLVRPYEVMRELWLASDPSLPPGSAIGFRESQVASIVPLWWFLFLGRNFAGSSIRLARQLGGSPIEKLVYATYSALTMYLLAIPAACAAIALVVLIERREDALLSSIEGAQSKEKYVAAPPSTPETREPGLRE